ncbi:MAG: 3-hydroxyacyl-CoA dehydrogenase NAD-binding domain-containing protein [Fimbriimonas sp.]|nr:3-hydroxyacyl-CoA dehydrogenase NAD-binding domain-containing protein [Fimbriimonas sp.]
MSDPASIKKICVIGAGTMGSGIAAHLSNLGFEVTLLDATHQMAVQAFGRAKSAKPPHFYVPDRANEIRLGGVNENAAWIGEADWVCEAIVERAAEKHALFSRIQPVLRPDAFLSTNTSGIPISSLARGFSESFRKRFVGTHFFNPPRYLKLLELIPTSETDPSVIAAFSAFLEERVARRVVVAKDTPGFIANRYGMWCMFHAIHTAEKLRLTVEQVDAITGFFLGRPKSASFRLNDIVGLDVMQDIAVSLIERCPNDPHIQTLKLPRSVAILLEKGWIGEKAGQGYYRRGSGKEFLVFDLSTFAYRQKTDVDLPGMKHLEKLPLPERILKGLDLKDETGEFLRHYLLPTLKYADYLKAEISHSVLDIDHVMQWGFGWQMGPFEMIDLIGPSRIGLPAGRYYESSSVRAMDGAYTPIRSDPKYIRMKECPLVSSRRNFNLRDLGDGVHSIGLTTKMGIVSPDVVEELSDFLENGSIDRFVLTGEGRSFSAGFDLRFFSQAIAQERWTDIDRELGRLQKLGELLERSNAVSAIFGHALGGGLELAISCPKVVSLVETQIGFPEAKVGLIPAGRGITLMRLYNQQNAKRLSEVAIHLGTGVVASNAVEARSLGFLRSTDVTVFHPDRLIYEAKMAALEVKPEVRPEVSQALGPLSGMIDRLLEMASAKGELSAYDEQIGQRMKMIFSKARTYDECIAKERTEFLDLCGRALTVARINHMLEHGTPLRN